MGQKILKHTLADQKSKEFRVDAVKAYYIVKVQGNAGVKVAKVVID